MQKDSMLGLKRGTVSLCEHDDKWSETSKNTINILWEVLDNVAIDIQHIGSTSISGIHAKPIIDIVIGLNNLKDIIPLINSLEERHIIYRGEDVENQLLFVMGDFKNNTRTHHIHVVKYKGQAWNNYINFRDYLNAYPQKAKEYDELKQKLAKEYSLDRQLYSLGKQELINRLLIEAHKWRGDFL